MAQPRGVYLPLSLPRRYICDLLHFARQVPTVPVERRMNLAAVVAARAAAQPRPSWCAVFTKAYAHVAAATPALRRAYLSFPWPRLYEHPANVAMVAVERQVGDENAVLFAPVCSPEQLGLTELDGYLRHYKEAPLETIPSFRRAFRLSRWPRFVRRWLWWAGLNWSWPERAHYAGTFGVTVYSGLGAASLHPLSVLTSTLNYGVIAPDGSVAVRLVYDHRVLDGCTVARALAELERTLQQEIFMELRDLYRSDTVPCEGNHCAGQPVAAG